MNTEAALTLWTVRCAVGLYVAALVLRWYASRRPAARALARLTWTIGCVAYLLHVGCAFHFYHQWSHDAAYAHTARQTSEVTGLAWGGGLYVNYVFTAVWLADAVWWWLGLDAYDKRPPLLDWAIHGFMAFIVFNATVVFAAGLTRWCGIAACVILFIAFLVVHAKRTGKNETRKQESTE